MRVSASLGFWYFLIFIIVWRQILKFNSLQHAIHRVFGKLTPGIQWYSIFFAGVLFYMLYSIRELLVDYDSLTRSEVLQSLEVTYNLPQNKAKLTNTSFEEFREPLVLRDWLRYLNIVSQFASIPTVVIAVYHVWVLLVLPGKKLAESHPNWNLIPWKPPTRMNWLLLVISMPTMFSVMSMRASCRMWAVMTGTAAGHETLPWPRVESIEFAMYTSDLELAALFQFSTVYAFARICGSILSDRAFFKGEAAGEDAAEYTYVIKTAGFLAVWAFVVVGMVRCLFSFVTAEAEQFDDYAEAAEKIQAAAMDSISTVFSAITILCVLNMIIICRMNIIKDRLGNATQKFMGTRLLLLAGEIQEKIVAAFTVGSALYKQVDKHSERFNFPIHKWNFSDEQAHLFHLSLLNLECLIVVIFNLVAWYQLDLEKSGIMNFKPLPTVSGTDNNKYVLHEEKAGLLDVGMDF